MLWCEDEDNAHINIDRQAPTAIIVVSHNNYHKTTTINNLPINNFCNNQDKSKEPDNPDNMCGQQQTKCVLLIQQKSVPKNLRDKNRVVNKPPLLQYDGVTTKTPSCRLHDTFEHHLLDSTQANHKLSKNKNNHDLLTNK